ncbi:MAG: sugar phosphate nucleotidyltransferase [Coriobacteriia bacterium]
MQHDVTAILVPRDASLVEAHKVLDESAGRILFVVDGDGVLAGVVTDGDVRRHLLAGRDLSDSVASAMNSDPVTVQQGYSEEHVRDVLLANRIECLPVLDASGRVVDAVWWTDVFGTGGVPRAHINLPIAIMAGGKGTRLEPYSSILPKPLMPVGDQPVLKFIMDRFHEQGCDNFLVSLNFKAGLIRAYFSDVSLPYKVSFFDEGEPLGTAGSLALMAPELRGTFVLTNCDTIVDVEFADVLAHHRREGNAITVLASMKHMVLPYGVCEVGESGTLKALKEKPRFDLLVSTGVYMLEPSALTGLAADGPTDATDLIAAAMNAGVRVGVYPIPERAWFDVGQIEELQDALDRLGMR